MATGIQRNNPLNVKGTGWRGQTGNDSRGHAIFKSLDYGTRAAIVTLRTYWFTHNLRTIAAILSRWAPSSDTVGSLPGAPPNSPKEYSAFVAKRVGVGATAKLSLFNSDRKVADADQLRKLVKAMAAYEIGGGYVLSDEVFDEALKLL